MNNEVELFERLTDIIQFNIDSVNLIHKAFVEVEAKILKKNVKDNLIEPLYWLFKTNRIRIVKKDFAFLYEPTKTYLSTDEFEIINDFEYYKSLDLDLHGQKIIPDYTEKIKTYKNNIQIHDDFKISNIRYKLENNFRLYSRVGYFKYSKVIDDFVFQFRFLDLRKTLVEINIKNLDDKRIINCSSKNKKRILSLMPEFLEAMKVEL